MTAGDILDTVLDQLAEDETTPVFWSRAELLNLLNDGFLEFTLMAGQLTSERTYAMIGAKVQAVPDGAIALMHVEYSNQPVEKTSVELMDRNKANWDSESGVLKRWAPCGLDQWFCDRQPLVAENVTLTTLDQPATLGEATVIDLDAEYIQGLTFYLFHAARFKESGAELEQAMTAYDDFLGIVGHREKRSFAAEFVLWSRDPNASTGIGYSTIDRS